MKRTNDATVATGACPPSLAWVVILLVGLHLLAVLAEPLRFFSQSDFQAGPEFAALRRWTAPYVEWMYLDHGYFFFAPNPGPSHLVAVDRKDQRPPLMLARPPEEGVPIDQYVYVFPDRKRHWPRLLYHRYFMLSEFYNNRFAPDRLLEEDRDDPDFVARWERDRALYVQLGASIERSMEKTLGSTEPLLLRRLERDLPSPDQVMKDGWQLDDPRGLYVLPEGPPDVAEPTGGEVVPP
jgi:hypothetical protein